LARRNFIGLVGFRVDPATSLSRVSSYGNDQDEAELIRRATKMIVGFFKRWRDSRAEAAAKRALLEVQFDTFLRETEPFVPQGSNHPRAALYRHAWKRAAVLGFIYERRSDQLRATQFKEFEKVAGERYFKAAPETLYGKAPLRMSEKTVARLLEFEMERLFPAKGKPVHVRPLACIYIGRCEKGRVYIGQTVGPPENRGLQHRLAGTGPFKNGAQYVQRSTLEGPVDPAKLDERDSYYIGFYNSYAEGYNETRGNDLKAYGRGQTDRKPDKADCA
jgi:hypothetical protein